MQTTNKELMKQARESLKGKWKVAVLSTLIYLAIMAVVNFTPYIGGLVSLIIAGPFALGLAMLWLNISRNHDAKIEQMFDGRHHFWQMVVTRILISWYTFLWTLLLIVPGIIASISYSMTYFIMADDPSLKPGEAIDKSKEMMYGYKWKYLYLNLRFLGWAILCLLTVGIGFLWLVPYMQVSIAKFYDDIKNKGKLPDEDILEVPKVIEVPKAN